MVGEYNIFFSVLNKPLIPVNGQIYEFLLYHKHISIGNWQDKAVSFNLYRKCILQSSWVNSNLVKNITFQEQYFGYPITQHQGIKFCWFAGILSAL